MTSALQPDSTAPDPANYEAALAELQSLVLAVEQQVRVLAGGERKPWPNPK